MRVTKKATTAVSKLTNADLVDVLLDDFGAEASGGIQGSSVGPLGLVALLAKSDLDAFGAEDLGGEDGGDAA